MYCLVNKGQTSVKSNNVLKKSMEDRSPSHNQVNDLKECDSKIEVPEFEQPTSWQHVVCLHFYTDISTGFSTTPGCQCYSKVVIGFFVGSDNRSKNGQLFTLAGPMSRHAKSLVLVS
jgi:hypothetical protein